MNRSPFFFSGFFSKKNMTSFDVPSHKLDYFFRRVAAWQINLCSQIVQNFVSTRTSVCTCACSLVFVYIRAVIVCVVFLLPLSLLLVLLLFLY